MLFGAAQSATALAAAPLISHWLARPSGARAWARVVAANSVAMSVYLWQFTAAVVAGGVLYGVGWLPSAEVGTAAWWGQKLPLVALSSMVLIGIGSTPAIIISAVVVLGARHFALGSSFGRALGRGSAEERTPSGFDHHRRTGAEPLGPGAAVRARLHG